MTEQEAIDYTIGLFKNGTIDQIKLFRKYNEDMRICPICSKSIKKNLPFQELTAKQICPICEL